MAAPPTPSADTPPPRTTGGNFRWEPPTAEELQALLPGYTIEKLLGKGGMGAVYKGVQISLDRPVAIKIISNDLDQADASFRERFKNEARAMAKLSHPGIVAVHDYGQTMNGILYIVMEYIEGTDVSRMIAQQKRLHTEHAMAITAHVCDALAYAHERGIIHRDIKPANIMVRNDGVVKVADFGLAKIMQSGESGLTQSGMAMGTLHYMAPEALMLGSAVDHRADIYAVGVMLYQMLTGKVPHGIFELPSMQVPGLDPRYDAIISQAMREDRDIRYQSVSELRHGLDNILTQPVTRVDPLATQAPAAVQAERPPQRSAGQPYRPPQSQATMHLPPKKSSALPWVAALVLAVAGGVGWLLFGASKPSVAANPLSSAVMPQQEPDVSEKAVVATPPAPNLTAPAASAPMPSTPADEKPLSEKVPLTSTPPSASLAESFKGHRYQFVPGSFTWLNAKAKAESMGGHLVTINTKEENDWLLLTYRKQFKATNQNIWLGASESAPGTGWKWVTGEPFFPLGWLPGEPNGTKGGGGSAGYPFMLNFYAFRDAVGWNDSSTHESQVRANIGFIVEWESEPAKAPSAPSASLTTWIDTKGRSLQAQFISLQGGSVILNIAGKPTPVLLSSLSAASQQIAQVFNASRSASANSAAPSQNRPEPYTALVPANTLDLKNGTTNSLLGHKADEGEETNREKPLRYFRARHGSGGGLTEMVDLREMAGFDQLRTMDDVAKFAAKVPGAVGFTAHPFFEKGDRYAKAVLWYTHRSRTSQSWPLHLFDEMEAKKGPEEAATPAAVSAAEVRINARLPEAKKLMDAAGTRGVKVSTANDNYEQQKTLALAVLRLGGFFVHFGEFATPNCVSCRSVVPGGTLFKCGLGINNVEHWNCCGAEAGVLRCRYWELIKAQDDVGTQAPSER